jgi:hypothetical protein
MSQENGSRRDVEEQYPPFPLVGGFVPFEFRPPYIPGPVDVHHPQPYQFSRPCARQAQQPENVAMMRLQLRGDGVDIGLVDRSARSGFRRRCFTSRQNADRGKLCGDCLGNHFP